jgi:hypothetical protein
MTLAELTEEVLENVALSPGGDKIQRGEVKRLLNLAMREVSLAVGVPTLYIDVPSVGFVTGRFAMPNRFHPEGIKYAEVVEVASAVSNATERMRNQEIAILSVQEANEFHPRWEDSDYQGVPFLIYSPAGLNEGFRQVGITTAKYRFLVHAVPSEMIDDTDEPFAILDYCEDPPIRRPGAMPAFHRVLAHFVSHELLQRIGDQRWQAYLARYELMRQEMFSDLQPVDVYMPSVRSSRRVKRYA